MAYKKPPKETQFKKGDDPKRNLKGRPPILPDLKEAIAKILSKEKDGKTALEAVLIALFNRAIKGDVRAAQELMDRGYGKAIQFIDGEFNIGSKETGFEEWTKEELEELIKLEERVNGRLNQSED